MEQRLVPGVVVEHAGQRWRVHRPLGPDAVLLRNDTGEIVSAAPARIGFPAGEDVPHPAMRVVDARNVSDVQWAEAARRRDLLAALAGRPARSRADVDAVAKELGIKRRRVWSLLQQTAASDGDIAAFLPRRSKPRAKRLGAGIEAIVTQAIDQHYAKANRPSLARLHKEVVERCKIAGVRSPSYRAVAARVRDRDQAWLVRRREGPKAAQALRLLTGAHPGAGTPWERVQIDSTPCDIRLVRETDRTVIGRPTVTFAIDLYSRVVLGFSASLEAASTITVATCLVHACLPKEDWLAQRDLTDIHWPVYGRPVTLEYDQGPENVARGVQRGLRRYGIAAKVRATGHPEQHGTIERLIGTMMKAVHALRGTTFSDVNERGESEPDKRACLSLPELERVLALTIDSYNHTTHVSIGERPMDRYLAYYRRPELPDSQRVPPRLSAGRLLLDFLPYETRALTRCGIRLFRVDYSSVDLLPLWRRDNQRRVARIVVYDPRSLARVWVLDESTDDYIPTPYRVPHPDMTLAQSAAARVALHASRARDRTEPRLFENLSEIRAIEATAKSATDRRKAERTRQATRSVRDDARRAPVADATKPVPEAAAQSPPAWAGTVVAPFDDVERL
jgi:putative transposase